MIDNLMTTRSSVWRPTGFKVMQERDRESDDMSKMSDLFTFEDLNPQVRFSTTFTRWERFKIGLFFIKRAVLGNR